MVPTEEIMERLRIAFLALRNLSLDIYSYEYPIDEVIVDMFTWGAAIAGIADRLLSGNRLSDEYILILRRDMPLQGATWRIESGELVDLSDLPEILNYAKAIDRVKNMALKVV